jgi:sugar-specific transcriptional regulator TrmB
VDKTLSDFYNQYERKLTNSQREIKRDVEQVLDSFDSSAMTEVISLSNEIGSIEEAEWIRKQTVLNNSLKSMISRASDNIEASINQGYESLLDEINEFGDKDTLVKYSQSIDRKLNSPSISIEEKKSLTIQKKSLDLLRQGGNKVASMAPGVDKLFGGISGASGSSLHEIVLNVGHFFGKSFKPWEAVRWASNIAKVAKFGIPVISMGIDIWMQCREDNKENERLQQIKNSKSQFITGYQSEINQVKSQFEQYLTSILENFTNKRNEINKSKEELIKVSNRNKQIESSIKELEGEYVDFIEIINGEETLHKL